MPMTTKHPETERLAQEAYRASGCSSHTAFIAIFPDKAIGMRTFRAWLAGEQPAAPMAQMMLREFIAGWRPSK